MIERTIGLEEDATFYRVIAPPWNDLYILCSSVTGRRLEWWL